MNWLVIAVVGAAAAWFEFNYQLSRHHQRSLARNTHNSSPNSPTAEAANVEPVGEPPSISPGAENDRKLNTTA